MFEKIVRAPAQGEGTSSSNKFSGTFSKQTACCLAHQVARFINTVSVLKRVVCIQGRFYSLMGVSPTASESARAALPALASSEAVVITAQPPTKANHIQCAPVARMHRHDCVHTFAVTLQQRAIPAASSPSQQHTRCHLLHLASTRTHMSMNSKHVLRHAAGCRWVRALRRLLSCWHWESQPVSPAAHLLLPAIPLLPRSEHVLRSHPAPG